MLTDVRLITVHYLRGQAHQADAVLCVESTKVASLSHPPRKLRISSVFTVDGLQVERQQDTDHQGCAAVGKSDYASSQSITGSSDFRVSATKVVSCVIRSLMLSIPATVDSANSVNRLLSVAVPSAAPLAVLLFT